MTAVNEPVRRQEPPRWMVRTRRVLDILATGGTILWTEPPKPRHPKRVK